MTTATTRQGIKAPAPQWLRDLITARTHYEELFGWPVTVDVKPRRLVLAVGQVLDAVTMPATAGQHLLAAMQTTLSAGPAIDEPGGAWWTFLTQPANASRPDIRAELHARKVYLIPQGAHVILPHLINGEGSSRWVAPPRPNHPLPPWPDVISATKRVVDHLMPAGPQ